MARGLQKAVRGVTLAGTSALAISCGSGETPPAPSEAPSVTSGQPTRPSQSPADKDVYPGMGILSVENGKTFIDGCFTVTNAEGEEVMGIVRRAYWINNRIIPLFFAVQGGTEPIGISKLTADNLYHPPNGSGVLHLENPPANVHCKAELQDMQFRDYAIGHLALIQRDEDNTILFGKAPFNETTLEVREGEAQTTLPDGNVVAVQYVEGPK